MGLFNATKCFLIEHLYFSYTDQFQAMASVIKASLVLFVVMLNGIICLPMQLSDSHFCRTRKFQMRVEAEGCESMTIENNYCFGQCLSQFFPTNWKHDLSQDHVICFACHPLMTYKKKVVLKCPGHPKKYDIQKIEIIKECRCKPAYCKVQDYYRRNYLFNTEN